MPGGEALTVILRSPRAPAGDPLLTERPARVAAEGANPFIKERRDHNEIMLIRPQHSSFFDSSFKMAWSKTVVLRAPGILCSFS